VLVDEVIVFVGKRRAARLAIAKGKDWSMQLHIFMSEKVNPGH
jgi:hypothetical protein